MAEVADSPRWHHRVSELLAHALATRDRVLLLVPSRLLGDCRSLVAPGRDRVDVMRDDPACAADPAALCRRADEGRSSPLAWLPAPAAFAPPDWGALANRRRCVVPWLPRYALPRDRPVEAALGASIGWLATSDLLEVFAGQAPRDSFLSLADRIHRERLPLAIASARVADDAPAPAARPAAALPSDARILAIVPHFRCEAWLATALASLVAQTRPAEAIVVVDDGSPAPPTDVVARFPGCTLLVAEGNHGPYRLIQQVIADTAYDGYLFQDADDWSAHDRLELLLREAVRSGADLVGCQEGRWEANAPAVCCLFPADANRALAAAPVHALLHPTSLVSRAFVLRAGGYATGLRFFGDAEFLWRAHHRGRVANTPFVSYFRQARAASLTGSPDTGHRSPARLRIKADCKQRFWDARQALAAGEVPPATPYRTAPPIALRHVTGPPL